MRKLIIECSKEWAENLKRKKVLKGKLYVYENNVPQTKPFLFKI